MYLRLQPILFLGAKVIFFILIKKYGLRGQYKKPFAKQSQMLCIPISKANLSEPIG